MKKATSVEMEDMSGLDELIAMGGDEPGTILVEGNHIKLAGGHYSGTVQQVQRLLKKETHGKLKRHKSLLLGDVDDK